MLRSLTLLLWYAAMIPAIGLIGIPVTFISGSVEWMYRAAMWAAYSGVQIIGVKVQAIGLDRFDPHGTYIYMCNHVSNLDPPIVVPLIPKRTSVLVKKEVFRVPILSKAMLMADFVPVDRRNRDAAIASIQKATEVMRSGVNITVFPEGTRSEDGNLLPLKKGPFHLAIESGIPVIPMTIVGTEKLLPKNSFRIKKGTVRLVFHAPISPKQFADREGLMEAVRRAIESGKQPVA